jgi:hypothetical protein
MSGTASSSWAPAAVLLCGAAGVALRAYWQTAALAQVGGAGGRWHHLDPFATEGPRARAPAGAE